VNSFVGWLPIWVKTRKEECNGEAARAALQPVPLRALRPPLLANGVLRAYAVGVGSYTQRRRQSPGLGRYPVIHPPRSRGAVIIGRGHDHQMRPWYSRETGG